MGVQRRPRLDEVFETLITRLIYEAEDELALEQAGGGGDDSSTTQSSSSANSSSDDKEDDAPPEAAEQDQDQDQDDELPELAPLCQRTLGLVSPIWWWTHRTAPTSSIVSGASVGVDANGVPTAASVLFAKHVCALHEREAKMVFQLLCWLQGQRGGKVGGAHRHSNKEDKKQQTTSIDMATVKILTVPDVLSHIEVFVKDRQLEQGVIDSKLKTATDFFGGVELVSAYTYAAKLQQAEWDINSVNSARIVDREAVAGGEQEAKCSVAIWALGSLSAQEQTVLNFSQDVEEYAAAFLSQALEAAIVVSDGGWIHSSVNWQSMRTIRGQKLGNMATDGLEGLFGSALPVACPMHPLTSRASVSGVDTIFGFCRQVCLKPFACGVANHVCVRSCHIADAAQVHSQCPYICTKPQPCGHPCKMSCGEPCNCLHTKEVPRPCSHKELLSYLPPGADEAQQQAEYQEVEHTVKGVCCQDLVKQYPDCAVKVSTPCSSCGNVMELTCHEVNRNVQQQEAGEAATAAPGAQCSNCLSKYRSLRAELRVTLSHEFEKKKQEMLREHRRNFEDQSRAAARGVFKPGQRVRITADEGIRDNQEDQFPNVDMEAWYEIGDLPTLVGQQCTIVQNLVDFTALEEVQYLVRLHDATGKHLMMADSGLALLQALAAGAHGSAASATGGPLLLTAGSHQQEQQHLAASAQNGDDQGGDSVPPLLPASVEEGLKTLYPDLPALGQMLHLNTATIVTLEADQGEGGQEKELADIAVKVVGHADAENLEVEYTLPRMATAYSRLVKKNNHGGGDDDGSPASKRRRLEDGAAADDVSADGPVLPFTTHRVVVPATAVTPLFTDGARVVVTDSAQQCVSLADKMSIPKAMYLATALITSGAEQHQAKTKKWKPLSTSEVYPHRLGFETSCIVLGIVNGLHDTAAAAAATAKGAGEEGFSSGSVVLSNPGPYYVLRPATVQDNQREERKIGSKSGRAEDAPLHPPAYKIALVPVCAVTLDSQFDAEKAMNQETVEALEKATTQQFEEWASEQRTRNLEKSWAFYQEKRERQRKQELLRMKAQGRAKANGSSDAPSADAGAPSASTKKTASATHGRVLTAKKIQTLEEEYVTKAHKDSQALETAKQLQRQAERKAKDIENQAGGGGWDGIIKQHQTNRALDDEYFQKRRGATSATPSITVGGRAVNGKSPPPQNHTYASYPQQPGRRF